MKAEDLFEKVTADLIAAIEDGAKDWRMPWHRLGASGLPRSVDGRAYRGWNALVLAMVAADRGWTSSIWATYNGWQRHGGQVRRGERGTQVVLWKPTERHETTDDGDDAVHRSLFARAFTVFAAEQVDGAERHTNDARERVDTGAADRGRRDLLRGRRCRRGQRRRPSVLRPRARPNPPPPPPPVRRAEPLLLDRRA